MLDELAGQLTPSELEARQDAFEQAREFVNRAAQAGGVGPVKKSFPRKPYGVGFASISRCREESPSFLMRSERVNREDAYGTASLQNVSGGRGRIQSG